MKEYKYVSYSNSGVDATDFYKDFVTNISKVSREVGITRQSASRFVINAASSENTEKIVLYLEKETSKQYEEAVKNCKKEIIDSINRLESEWKNYQKKEAILEEYRVKRRIVRKTAIADKTDICEILETIKRL